VQVLIVVDNPHNWPLDISGVEVVAAREYVMNSAYGALRAAKVVNLCRSYRYQSLGYYVSLLATARGHKPMPSVTTMQDFTSHSMVRVITDDLDELIQKSLAPLRSETFDLYIYFGRAQAKRYARLSRQLFNLFQAPLLQAHFVCRNRWHLRQITPMPASAIPDAHRAFVVQAATEHFAGRRNNRRKCTPQRYDLAILRDASEALPPSDKQALQRFVKAADALGLHTEFIKRDDYARMAEFDALFIRATTRVNHYTYRFARRAASEGLVVMDDPESILQCCNKVYLAELLNRHKIPMPRTYVVHGNNVDAMAHDLDFPCVLKEPDSAFSQGVVKVDNRAAFLSQAQRMLAQSDLIIVQTFLPTPFDWRVGICDQQPLYVCKYYMASRHWQIHRTDRAGRHRFGAVETIAVENAPSQVVRTARRAANLIGNGLYGVDLKQVGRQCYVIEINDNPNIDAETEDSILGDELYRRIMRTFLQRLEHRSTGPSPAPAR
jgi:glutathione synthase/RimK-type ligase-like ATP-grasp enzyme